jgi:small subunit ribosomal protein S18
MPPKSRSKNKDNARRAKKKTSLLITEGVEYVDWKDVNLLRRFMSDRSKVRARRVTGNSAQQQASVAKAIKNAREMALLPYVTRITQQRGGRGDRGPRGERGDRGDRGERGERGPRDDRAPRPSVPGADGESPVPEAEVAAANGSDS